VAVLGHQGGGAMGLALATRNRDWIRGLSMIDSLPTQRPPENEPPHRLALYLALAEKGTTAATRETVIGALRQIKHPLTVKELGAEPRSLTPDELAELFRWIDTLDRL
jgi:pimeloyl-ACP methyl ester carboxylesterase